MGVAKQPRELISHPKSLAIRDFCIAVCHVSLSSAHGVPSPTFARLALRAGRSAGPKHPALRALAWCDFPAQPELTLTRCVFSAVMNLVHGFFEWRPMRASRCGSSSIWYLARYAYRSSVPSTLAIFTSCQHTWRCTPSELAATHSDMNDGQEPGVTHEQREIDSPREQCERAAATGRARAVFAASAHTRV